MDHFKTDIEMRVENWESKIGSGLIETAGIFCVIVDRYMWKWLKKVFYCRRSEIVHICKLVTQC